MRALVASGLLALLAALVVAPPPAAAQADPAGRRERAQHLEAMGQALRAAGNASSAIAYFRNAVRVDPDAAGPYEDLAGLFLDQGRVADAVDVIAEGLRHAPDAPGLWRARVRALIARGALDRAAHALRELVARAPDDVAARGQQADLARRRGAWSEALAAYRALLDLEASGATVRPELLRDAHRYVRALSLLSGDLDPVATVDCRTEPSPVRRALAGCAAPTRSTPPRP